MLDYLQVVATRFIVEEDGQAMTEYGLILVLVAIVSMALLQLVGVNTTGLLGSISF
jgi:Flp pilus assembly pilin Flp